MATPISASRCSASPEETLALGAEFGARARPGEVYGLIGDLGAGKTQFVKGFARGLGAAERVHSPTFTLVNEYRGGRMPCFHLDLYRLETAADFFQAGLEPYLRPWEGVSVIEWFDRLEGEAKKLADRLVVVRLEVASETERRIIYEDPGA